MLQTATWLKIKCRHLLVIWISNEAHVQFELITTYISNNLTTTKKKSATNGENKGRNRKYNETRKAQQTVKTRNNVIAIERITTEQSFYFPSCNSVWISTAFFNVWAHHSVGFKNKSPRCNRRFFLPPLCQIWPRYLFTIGYFKVFNV